MMRMITDRTVRGGWSSGVLPDPDDVYCSLLGVLTLHSILTAAGVRGRGRVQAGTSHAFLCRLRRRRRLRNPTFAPGALTDVHIRVRAEWVGGGQGWGPAWRFLRGFLVPCRYDTMLTLFCLVARAGPRGAG